MPKDKIIHKISWRYAIEPMSGKENTYILRRRDGLILVFIEKVNNHIVSVRYHQTRNLSRRLLNYLAQFIISSGWYVSAEAAHTLGISIIRYHDGSEQYVTFPDLRRGRYISLLQNNRDKTLAINSLSIHNLSLPDNIQSLTLETIGAQIKKLKIGNNSNININLRDNHLIKQLLVGNNFTGKIFLNNSDIKKFVLGHDAQAEISYIYGTKPLSLVIGHNFQGSLSIGQSYLNGLSIGNNSSGHIKLNKCVSFRPLSIGHDSQSHIESSSIYAPYFAIGNNYSGFLKGRNPNPKQGVRKLFVGASFSGHIDLSNSQTISRIEFGKSASGALELVSCRSIRLVKYDSGFCGSADFRESSIAYVRALSPCQGEMIFSDCKMLTLLKLPLRNECKIIGSGKPIKNLKKRHYAYFYFKNYILPKAYFSSIWDTLFPFKK